MTAAEAEAALRLGETLDLLVLSHDREGFMPVQLLGVHIGRFRSPPTYTRGSGRFEGAPGTFMEGVEIAVMEGSEAALRRALLNTVGKKWGTR